MCRAGATIAKRRALARFVMSDKCTFGRRLVAVAAAAAAAACPVSVVDENQGCLNMLRIVAVLLLLMRFAERGEKQRLVLLVVLAFAGRRCALFVALAAAGAVWCARAGYCGSMQAAAEQRYARVCGRRR